MSRPPCRLAKARQVTLDRGPDPDGRTERFRVPDDGYPRRTDPARVYVDARGVSWTVREVVCGDEPWAKGARCLVFATDTAIRRIWRYPADWHRLSDDALETLSWTT